MTVSLADTLRALQVPSLRDGVEIRVLLETITRYARIACAKGLVSDADRDDLVQDVLLALMSTRSIFREHSDGEARAYLKSTVNARAIDRSRKHRRSRRTIEAFALRCSVVAYSGDQGIVAVAVDLRRAMQRLARGMRARGLESDIIGLLDAHGMLGWTERARLEDVELAARLRIRVNTLHARRSRLRRSVADATAAMVRTGELSASERDMLLALVSAGR